MMTRQCLRSLALLALVPLSSARSQPHQPAEPAPPIFERDVLPILSAHCLQCHGGLQQKGKLDLRTLKAIQAGGRQGPALVPREPDRSLIWTMIHKDEMPPKPIKVSAEQKQVIHRWIKAGAASASLSNVLAIPAQARTAAALADLIDRAIDSQLAREQVPASPQADDGEFLRRLHLDLVGRIPSRAQAVAFLDSQDADKRRQLIDRLLADPTYGHYWARLWRDRVAVPVAAGEDLRGSHTEAFHQWLAEAFNRNRPWDELVREMLAAEGESPPVAFIRQCMDDGQPRAAKLAASAARRFLGIQLQCAECHDHPFAAWKQEEFWGLAAFFSRTCQDSSPQKRGIVETAQGPPKTRFGLLPLVRKEEGSVVIPADAGPRAGTPVPARLLAGEVVKLPADQPARPALAEWVTSSRNPYFARATVNRLWAQLFGRGLVDPVDSLDADNLPSHPELFDALAGELVASGYDLKHLLRAMLLSQAYQRTHRPLPGNEKDATLRSQAAVKVLPPESFYDCLVLASGGDPAQRDAGVAVVGRRYRGVMSNRRDFLKLFGTADIDGQPGDYTQGIPQVLALLNESATNLEVKLVEQAVKEGGDPAAVVSRLFLSVLSRRPTAAELQRLTEFVNQQPSRPGRYQAIWWALVNSPEFAVIP